MAQFQDTKKAIPSFSSRRTFQTGLRSWVQGCKISIVMLVELKLRVQYMIRMCGLSLIGWFRLVLEDAFLICLISDPNLQSPALTFTRPTNFSLLSVPTLLHASYVSHYSSKSILKLQNALYQPDSLLSEKPPFLGSLLLGLLESSSPRSMFKHISYSLVHRRRAL